MTHPPRIAINGFGRIGRLVLRALIEHEDPIDIVAINDLTDTQTTAHLFKHDTLHGEYPGTVTVNNGDLEVNGERFHVLAQPDIQQIPWDKFDTDYVIECTGRYRHRDELETHLDNGAHRVILSAPAKDPIDATLVLGVNDDVYDPATDHVISNASCTTNCLAPTAKVLHDAYGIEHGYMSTVHAYTNSQNLLDAPHKDLRRARAAAANIVPTTTGAARAIGDVIPELDGRLDGHALRVPIPNVSIINLTAHLETATTTDAIKDAYQDAANGPLDGILRVEETPLVSSDYQTSPYSAIVDAPSLTVMNDKLANVLAWYDNEWGYAKRTADLAMTMWRQEPNT